MTYNSVYTIQKHKQYCKKWTKWPRSTLKILTTNFKDNYYKKK